MSSPLSSLIGPSEALESALSHVEHASTLFSSPDPALRSQGEKVFLALRDLPDSLEAASFFLGRSFDPFVNFQSLGLILHLLPSLPLHSPSSQIHSLAQLRDFILQIAITRAQLAITQQQANPSSQSSNSGPFPQYLRSRFYQTFSALQKRCLGLELSRIAPGEESAVRSFISNQMSSLSEKSLGIMRSNSDGLDQNLVHENINTGLSIIRSLLDEFSLSSAKNRSEDLDSKKASDKSKSKQTTTTAVGLGLLQHRWCKVSIQRYLLPEWLNGTLSMLNDSLNRLSSPNQGIPDQTRLMELKTFDALISTIEKLLNWNFILKKPEAGLFQNANGGGEESDVYHLLESNPEENYYSSSSSTSTSILQAFKNRSIPESLTSLLLSKDLILLLFNSYRYSSSLNSHSSSSTIHRLRQCLLLCTSFQVQSSRSNTQSDSPLYLPRNEAILNAMETLIQEENHKSAGLLVNKGNSLLFLIQSLQVLINNNSALSVSSALISNSGPEKVNHFFNSISQLTTNAFDFAFGRPRNTDEEDDLKVLSEELIDSTLIFWENFSDLIQESLRKQNSSGSSENQSRLNTFSELSSLSIRQILIPKYIDGRLSSASLSILSDSDDIVSEIGSEALSDQELFADQLSFFSDLARNSAFESASFLLERAKPLVEKMILISQGNWEALPGGAGVDRNKELEILWEQIHWITLISGNVLADDPGGETPEIPVDISKLGTLNENPAVLLINQLGVTLLHHLLKPHVNSPQTSPQVIQTLLWFNSRWVPTYLLARLDPSQNNFGLAFGSQSGVDLLSFILQSLIDTLSQWLADPDVVTQVSNQLFAFTLSHEVMQILLSRPEFDRLIRATIDGLDALPNGTHGKLCEALVKCIYASAKASNSSNHPPQGPEQVFNLITSAIESRLSSVLHSQDFKQNPQRSDVILNLQNSLDMLEGLASSATPLSAGPVYDFVSRFFGTLIGLVQTYSSRIEIIISIIKVFRTLIRSLELGFGVEIYILKGLNSAIYNLLHMIQVSRVGDLLVPKNSSQALEDDIPFEGLMLIIESLRDLLEATPEQEGETEDEENNWLNPNLTPDSTSDVCLYGFSTILPLLTSSHSNLEGPLEIPYIKETFGELISGLVQLFSGRLIGLALGSGSFQSNDQGGRQILESVVKGLTLTLEADESDICLDALDSISPFCRDVVGISEKARSAQISTEIIQQALDHILTTVLRSILLEPLDSSMLESYLGAVRTLILTRRFDSLGGPDSIVQTLHHFCLTTSVVSQRDPETSRKSNSLSSGEGPTRNLSSEVEAERRGLLSSAVEKLVGAVFQAPLAKIPDMRLDRMSAVKAIDQDYEVQESFLDFGLKVVGKVRSVLRVR